MKKIKTTIIILTLATLVSLTLGSMTLAQPLFEEKSFQKIKYVQDEIIVKFKGDVRPFRVVKVPRSKVLEKVREYRQRADVVYSEPNYMAYALMVPNDPYYSYQWHLQGINLEPAWDIQTGDSEIKVAIIDTGVAYEDYRQGWWSRYYLAPDLAETSFVAGYDFINNDSHPNDDNGHGTHVCGTAAQSTNNNLGVAGVAFNTSIMPVKVLDSNGAGSYAQVADGIYFAADNGAKVINLSLGGGADSNILKEAVAYAYNKGVTIVAAAGNDGSNDISYPAAYDDYVIAVGATRYDKTLADYSNYGPSLDLVAPGGDLNVDQNNDGYGDGVLQQTFGRRTDDFGYYFYQGTSMATPHVAGVAALVLANGTASTPDEVRTVLQKTAEDLGATGFDQTYGWGLVDALAALNWTAGPDTDGDGVIDSEDACPTTPGTYCNGCPEPICSGCQSAICPATGVPTCADDDSLCTAPNAVGTCTGALCSYTCNSGYGNCDNDPANGCEVNLFTDSNNCGYCGNLCGTVTCPASGCGVGSCAEEEYGTYPGTQQTSCVDSACSGECTATCAYDAACDADDDNDGVLDINDACPTTYGTDCHGCPNPCSGCAVMDCPTEIAPPTCPAGTCPDTVCPADGCGLGTCADNEYGTYTTASNVCNVADNIGTCTENLCTLECVSSQACEVSTVICWSGSNEYLYRNRDQAKKFCQCASGFYGYKSYNYNRLREIVYYYLDSDDNENWDVSSRSSYLPVNSVTCPDGLTYPTNQDYSYE